MNKAIEHRGQDIKVETTLRNTEIITETAKKLVRLLARQAALDEAKNCAIINGGGSL